MTKEYTYHLRLRPAGPGCQPKGTTRIGWEPETKNGRTYHGTVTYDRALTEEEKDDYELDDLN